MIAQKFERYTAIVAITTLLGSTALTAQVPAADPLGASARSSHELLYKRRIPGQA